MIVDVHAHVFPPRVAAERDRFLAQDATFAELYAVPKAALATEADLRRSMDDAGIDVSVGLGFAWKDEATCRWHNDYLLESAAASGGRLLPFCNLPLGAGAERVVAEAERCLQAGARGFGELRPESQGCDLTGETGARLARIARETDAALLFHVSEPVGHAYPGKEGLSLAAFAAFASRWPDLKTIGAHWGGGLPFYASMPEVAATLEHMHFDTAASSLLYGEDVYERGVALAGAEHVLYGSDFPLLAQSKSRARIEASGLGAAAKALVLGENARRLLKLE